MENVQSDQTMTDWKEDILKKWGAKERKRRNFVTDELRDRLAKEFRGEVLYAEPMAKHTYIRIGGPADIFLKPERLVDIGAVLRMAEEMEIPVTLVGLGSNTLVRDGGLRGIVMTPNSALHTFQVQAEQEDSVDILAEAGVGMTAFVNKCAELGLTGMESLIGIPGCMGGVISMNAGARGTEIKDILREVTIMELDGNLKTISREKLEFTYRHVKLPRGSVVISGLFRLQKGNKEEITETIKQYQKKRAETQPLNYPNLGSIFKNPQPQKKGEIVVAAGKLIEECGLKNIRVGGARISEKHANFIINERQATARDVTVLINLVRDKVKEVTGVALETEIKIIGDDTEEKK